MTIALAVFLWGLVGTLAFFAHRKSGAPALRASGAFAWKTGIGLAPRLCFALLAASFLSEVVPRVWIASTIGDESGAGGILLASLIGGSLLGGPMVSFPLALFLWQAGAGTPQMIALLSGWSIFAFHRTLAYEVPMMGWRFVGIRLAATLILPPLTGLLAVAAMAVLGQDPSVRPGP